GKHLQDGQPAVARQEPADGDLLPVGEELAEQVLELAGPAGRRYVVEPRLDQGDQVREGEQLAPLNRQVPIEQNVAGEGSLDRLQQGGRALVLGQKIDRWRCCVRSWAQRLAHMLVRGEAGQDDFWYRAIGPSQEEAADIALVGIVDHANVDNGYMDPI